MQESDNKLKELWWQEEEYDNGTISILSRENMLLYLNTSRIFLDKDEISFRDIQEKFKKWYGQDGIKSFQYIFDTFVEGYKERMEETITLDTKFEGSYLANDLWNYHNDLLVKICPPSYHFMKEDIPQNILEKYIEERNGMWESFSEFNYDDKDSIFSELKKEGFSIFEYTSLLDSCIEYVQINNRVCPMPQYWAKMYEMFRKEIRGTPEMRPLILGGWGAPDEAKRKIVITQLFEAEKEGILLEVDDFLKRLKEEDWYKSSK
tara:strand:+ start:507 stop:1295 length:789 start_codon:yes stop_codon:yes gene_type:complete